jgi:hypothetical protein
VVPELVELGGGMGELPPAPPVEPAR